MRISAERPRKVSPALLIFCRLGEYEGIRLLRIAPWSEVIASCCSICSRLITVIFCGVLPASLLARVALIVTASSSVASSAAVAGRDERERDAREIDKHRLVLRNT